MFIYHNNQILLKLIEMYKWNRVNHKRYKCENIKYKVMSCLKGKQQRVIYVFCPTILNSICLVELIVGNMYIAIVWVQWEVGTRLITWRTYMAFCEKRNEKKERKKEEALERYLSRASIRILRSHAIPFSLSQLLNFFSFCSLNFLTIFY